MEWTQLAEQPRKEALIALMSMADLRLQALRYMVSQILKNFQIQSLSSVYKAQLSHQKSETVHVALRVLCQKSSDELLQALRDLEMSAREQVFHCEARIYLLNYDSQVVLSPQLTLPFYELHRRPELLFPAVEVWGDFFHPVLKANLLSLTNKVENNDWGEFFAQGKSLLAF